ncbi:CheR family methyltransferase [Candidatus Margulisiibacteriota bacterium]
MKTIRLTEDEFELFKELLIKESGLYFDFDRKYILEDTLLTRMGACGFFAYQRYYDYLVHDRDGMLELKRLFDTLTIGETYFFRNSDHFEVFREFVVPRLIAAGHRKKQAIKIWSAGCSTGEEPYTVAMILLESLPDPEKWEIEIIASDLNRRYLEKAGRGSYSARSVRNLPRELLKKYFTLKDGQYQISEKIKNMVKFVYHNLAKDSFWLIENYRFDIVFCRNVIIYFDTETVKRVIEGFNEVMEDNAYLFCGHAEVLWKISEKFRSIEFPHTFIYQKGEFAAEETKVPFVDVPQIEIKVEAGPEPVPEPGDIHQKILLAVELSNQAKYNEAIEVLKEIIGCDCLTVEAYYLLGVLNNKIGQLDRAVAEFKRALFLNPELPIVYYNLGNIFLYQKDELGARREFKNAIKILHNRAPDSSVDFSENLNSELLLIACKRSVEKIK